jgi:superfamily II DNA or RNA helicase
MTCFPDAFRFRHDWRPYQARVLGEFERHIGDGHFHIAAAPGAGKTLLGLEALRRLQRPALVLAPTTAIRDQWLLRLGDAFLDQSEAPDWVSRELESPGLITLSTYQGLHAAQRRLGLPELLARLQAAGIGTLVLDEAHHLRQSWWQSLVALKAGLEAPRVVALTATPPFDVPQQEWNRYIELCGPLDAEVSVPELVRAGNLSPHQDYVYFSTPAGEERERLDGFEQAVRTLLNELAFDQGLLRRLAELPLVTQPQTQLDALTRRSDFALALALFLQQSVPETARALLHTLGLGEARLPAFGRDWSELLLTGLLCGREAALDAQEPLAQDLLRRLRGIGAFEQGQVYLRAPPHLLRLLEASRRKCESVAAVIDLEARADPIGLRALVLCDRIRVEDFPSPGEAERDYRHLGVVPVFEHLRRLRLPEVRLGVLTGSLIVLPKEALPALREMLEAMGTAVTASEALWHAPGFVRLAVPAAQAGLLLQAMTALFQSGEVNVLVGTAALLGEGWDAPALSTLVLATAVRTAMSSNQLRGRAIRVQPGNPDKAANIWHLACLYPGTTCEARGGADLERLAQRFRAFAGVGLEAAAIENGIERLGLDPIAIAAADCDALNARMCRLAGDRFAMRRAWRDALEDRSARPQRLLLETRVAPRRLLAQASFLHRLGLARWPLLRWWQARRLRNRLQRSAEALLEALRGQGLVGEAPMQVEVRLGAERVHCRLRGASTHEESLFAECLREFFDLPGAPRYLLRQHEAHFAVPACLGAHQRHASRLREAYARRLGRAELVYTRSEAGRRALLQAREQWLAQRFEGGCDTRQLWA